MSSSKKTGILLLNMGGPDGLESVKPFLYNLFSDPDIIRLPLSSIFQKPLAYYIASVREKPAQKNYALMGGSSPILKYSQAQGEALREALVERGHEALPVYVAMRYWHPFTEETVANMQRDGIERVIVLPLYPHFSYTTTGSSLNELRRVMLARGVQWQISVVPAYYQHPLYLQAVAENIRFAMQQYCWDCEADAIQLVFSAHSLPLKHVKRTQDPYPDQIYTCAQTIAQTYFPNNPWDLCYQSQVGNMPWLGPSTEGILHYFSGMKRDNLLLVALSFVSDHVETLVEIDREYLPLAAELQIQHCHRAPALNTSPLFIQALADLVTTELEKGASDDAALFASFPELLKSQVGSTTN